jgi:hypothetical protein
MCEVLVSCERVAASSGKSAGACYFLLGKNKAMKGGKRDILASLSSSARDEGTRSCEALAPKVCNVGLLVLGWSWFVRSSRVSLPLW